MLTSIKAPKQILEELDKVRRHFLWAGDGEITGGKCKVAWPLVARPVQVGGLSILDLERFSRALQLQWLWLAWSSNQRPWVGMKLPIDETDIALFTAATRVSVRDRRKASFWLSSWIDGQSLALLFPCLYQHSRRKHRSVREAVLNEKWIEDIAHDLNADILRELFLLLQLIQSMQLDLTSEHEDQITWTLESSGNYSTRSTYEIQFSGKSSPISRDSSGKLGPHHAANSLCGCSCKIECGQQPGYS